MLKSSVKMPPTLAFIEEMAYLCDVFKTPRSLKNCPHQSRSGYSSNFYEMPSKALLAMAGLDRKVLNSRRITKLVAPSNPVFSRSFITSFGVASYNKERDAPSMPSRPFSFKKSGSVWLFKRKSVHLHRKNQQNSTRQ
jgi:hypothetical protein